MKEQETAEKALLAMVARVVLTCLAIVALCACTARSLETEDDPMLDDGRILDNKNPNLTGRSVQIVPGPVTAGATFFRQRFPILQVSGDHRDTEMLVLTVDANASNDPATDFNVDRVLVLAVLEFGAGSAQFGAGSTVVAPGNNPTAQEILFDVGTGVQLAFPAAFVKLSIEYVGMKIGGYAGGAAAGPNFQVNAHLGYGTTDNSNSIAKTDPLGNIAAASFAIVARAKFATAVEVTWSGAATPANLQFRGLWGVGSTIWAPSIAATTVPPPRLPWPEGATHLLITNGDGALMMNQLSTKQYLDF